MGAEPAPFSPERSGDVNVVNLLSCRASFNEALGKLQLPSETFVMDAYRILTRAARATLNCSAVPHISSPGRLTGKALFEYLKENGIWLPTFAWGHGDGSAHSSLAMAGRGWTGRGVTNGPLVTPAASRTVPEPTLGRPDP